MSSSQNGYSVQDADDCKYYEILPGFSLPFVQTIADMCLLIS